MRGPIQTPGVRPYSARYAAMSRMRTTIYKGMRVAGQAVMQAGRYIGRGLYVAWNWLWRMGKRFATAVAKFTGKVTGKAGRAVGRGLVKGVKGAAKGVDNFNENIAIGIQEARKGPRPTEPGRAQRSFDRAVKRTKRRVYLVEGLATYGIVFGKDITIKGGR